MPPQPVVVKWNTWFNAIIYAEKHYEHLSAFVDAELASENSTQALVRLRDLFSDKIASWLLAYPTNTAEVERSISRYNNILSNDRNCLSEENVKALNFVQFNDLAFMKLDVCTSKRELNFQDGKESDQEDFEDSSDILVLENSSCSEKSDTELMNI